MGSDPKWTKWTEWLGRDAARGTITRDVYTMIYARQIWESYQEILAVAPAAPRRFGTFHSWFDASYLQVQGSAVRRQVDDGKRSASLVRLLRSIAKSASVLSRERFLAELYPDDPHYGNADFDRLVGPGADEVTGSAVRDELKRLKSGTM